MHKLKNSHVEIPKLLNLRRGLKALFHYQDVDSVIDALCSEKRHLYKHDLNVQLEGLLRLEPEGYTIDQNYSVATEFSHSYQTHGIFDALSAFVLSSCDMVNGQVVCRKESLLRWHETSSLLSEDLLVCTYLSFSQIVPQDYAWVPFVSTDRVEINSILKKELADVHAHLVGSSFNFDVNWLCLMNHIDGRESLFNELGATVQSRTTSIHYQNVRRSYHTLSVIAAAIRVVLFSRLVCIKTTSEQLLLDALGSNNDLDADSLIGCINCDVKTFAQDGYAYLNPENGISMHYDYAHRAYLGAPANELCAFSVFTGERYIIYNVLKRLYSDQLSEYDTSLFYIYLLIKHKIRHELIQNNEETGFRNFHIYDKRKVLFLAGITGFADYMGLLKHLSVASMFAEYGETRWLETRMQPWDNISKQIKRTDSHILDPKLKRDNNPLNYGYVFHFIKNADNTPRELFGLDVRHEELRNRLKTQAKKIVEARKKIAGEITNGLQSKQKILGIDAASSEIVARPEVFAQAFRYCRRCVPDIGITYHVGEDFHDIVDGLRAIDECIRYLDLQPHDRLGHALAIGTNVVQYYNRRRNVITIPKQVALDNVVWLHHQLKNSCSKQSLTRYLEDKYKTLFGELYGTSYYDTDIDMYYKSWLLRGDDPHQYQSTGIVETSDDVDIKWHNERFLLHEENNAARNDFAIQRLYYLYHHDEKIKLEGTEMTVLEYTPDMIKAIIRVQKRLLDKVERLKLYIECNPTSNFRIGDIDRYDEHPIRKFYSKGLNGCLFGRKISSSINTDDKGVFATSIEREYTLIAESLIRDLGGTQKAEQRVVKWLDNIRECSMNQKFV